MRLRRNNAPAKARELYDACEHVSSQARRYSYGGGHSTALRDIRPHDGLDCSGSSSLALARAGLFRPTHAWTAEQFANYGNAGRGRWVTVWYRAGGKGVAHVWIQFHGLGRFWRFDTSPWGSGGLGPRMRMLPRSTAGFQPRHPPGL